MEKRLLYGRQCGHQVRRGRHCCIVYSQSIPEQLENGGRSKRHVERETVAPVDVRLRGGQFAFATFFPTGSLETNDHLPGNVQHSNLLNCSHGGV